MNANKLIEILEEQQKVYEKLLSKEMPSEGKAFLYGKVSAAKEIIAIAKLVLEVK